MSPAEHYQVRGERLQKAEQQAAAEFYQAVRRATERYEGRRAELDRRRQELQGIRDEAVVMVRRGPGPAPEVFHRADGYCGWRPGSSSREEMFESEAFDRGLRPCSSCAA